MSTQYDNIGALYNAMKLLPVAKLEKSNLRAAIAPTIQGAHVLDLACGSGYYARAMQLEWGARSVVGVDISKAMVDVARRSLVDHQDAGGGRLGLVEKVKFAVGDCEEPRRYHRLMDGGGMGEGEGEGEGEFDVVIGAWLLNYASSSVRLTSMFRNIAINLKPGGTFAGITPSPMDEFETRKKALEASGRKGKFNLVVEFGDELLDGGEGYRTHVCGLTEEGNVEFDNFHLRKSVYENAARAAGLLGSLQWKDIQLPETEEESMRDFGVELGYWDGYADAPHCGILVIKK